MLLGAEAFVNASTPGSGFGGAHDNTTLITNGFNHNNGYVARFIGH